MGLYIKNIALFFAAPFIGLAYMLAMPIIGVGVLIYLGIKSLSAQLA